MKKYVLLIVAAALFFVAGCAQEENRNEQAGEETEGKPALNIGYVTILANAPGIIADKKGLFSDDLEVNTYGFNSGPELYQALAAGELDVAYAGVPATVNWSSRGLPVKLIAKVNEGKIGVIAAGDSAISSVSELKGDVLGGVKRGSGVDILTRGFILPSAGLTPDDVTIQELKQANIEAAVESGQVAAGVINEPFVTYALLRGKKLIAEEKDPALVIITTDQALNEKKEAVQIFIKKHKEAIRFLNEQNEEANQLLAEVFNIASVGDYSPEEVIIKAREKMNYDWQFIDDDFEYYQQLADASYELGYVDEKIDVKTLFDLDVVEGVVRE